MLPRHQMLKSIAFESDGVSLSRVSREASHDYSSVTHFTNHYAEGRGWAHITHGLDQLSPPSSDAEGHDVHAIAVFHEIHCLVGLVYDLKKFLFIFFL